MVSKTRAWFNRLGSNVSHIVSGAVHGVENNIGHVLGSVESHVTADVTTLANQRKSQIGSDYRTLARIMASWFLHILPGFLAVVCSKSCVWCLRVETDSRRRQGRIGPLSEM